MSELLEVFDKNETAIIVFGGCVFVFPSLHMTLVLLFLLVQVMQQYVTDFRQARQEMMGNDMMSTGQQVIAALYSGKLKTQVSVV